MPAKLARLVGQAMQSTRAGRFDEADALWLQVLEIEPSHTQALSSLGVNALRRGDVVTAVDRLEAARITAPTDLFVLIALADARREADDPDGELEALQWALAVDAEYVPALLHTGNWYEVRNDATRAYDTYRRALENSHSESQWPRQHRAELGHARDFIERHSRKLYDHITLDIADGLSALDDATAGRWREAASVHAGRSAPYVSASSKLHVPRLPAIPFFDPKEFPFLEALTVNAGQIRVELDAILAQQPDRFRPYVAFQPGEPVHQWQDLNHSARWSACHLWRNGQPVEDNLARCPATAKLIDRIPLCDLDGVSPNVFFSALAPKTRIPPHHGKSNARVIGHLPLNVPRDCCLRVGFEERAWREGEVLIFDDTLEHEAFNDSDDMHAVMVFDLWNPLLSDDDRRLANALVEATLGFAGLVAFS